MDLPLISPVSFTYLFLYQYRTYPLASFFLHHNSFNVCWFCPLESKKEYLEVKE